MKKLTLSTLLSVSLLGCISETFAMMFDPISGVDQRRAFNGVERAFFLSGRATSQRIPDVKFSDKDFAALSAKAPEFVAEIEKRESEWRGNETMSICEKEKQTEPFWEQLTVLQKEQEARKGRVFKDPAGAGLAPVSDSMDVTSGQQMQSFSPELEDKIKTLSTKSLISNAVIAVSAVLERHFGLDGASALSLRARNRDNDLIYKLTHGPVTTIDETLWSTDGRRMEVNFLVRKRGDDPRKFSLKSSGREYVWTMQQIPDQYDFIVVSFGGRAVSQVHFTLLYPSSVAHPNISSILCQSGGIYPQTIFYPDPQRPMEGIQAEESPEPRKVVAARRRGHGE